MPTMPTMPTMPASRHALPAAMAALVAVDLGGGLLAVHAGVNTWAEAWGGAALLAAPAPMIVAQLVLTATAVLRRDRLAVAAAVVLSLACLVSVASGFFDGGLGNDRLTDGLVGYQVFLLAVTGVVGVLAAARTRVLAVQPVQHV